MQSFGMNPLHLISTILFSFILGSNAFSYKDAKDWEKKYPECNGKHQSPIILKSPGEFGYKYIDESLTLKDFKKLPTKMTIQNTGHTVEIKADWSGKPPRLTGGPLRGNYVFEKITFHWAQKKWSDEMPPRDMHLDQSMHDMEMHVFFYKTKFKSFEKAETQKGGLAVFNMRLLTGYDNPEHMFDNLERSLHKVKSINASTEITPFHFASIIDNGFSQYLFYEGSLDYPPCSESVTWFIDNSGIIIITDNLLKGFKKIKLAEEDVSNVRPHQALNNRPVKVVYPFKMG